MSQRTGNCAGPLLHYAVFRVLLFCEDLLDGALYSESVHKAPELFGGELPGLIRGTRPLEPVPAKKDLSQKEHAVAFFSEHSEKKGYPQGFVIRTFSESIRKALGFHDLFLKNVRITLLNAIHRGGQFRLHRPATQALRFRWR